MVDFQERFRTFVNRTYEAATAEFPDGIRVSMTVREGDKADPGYREVFRKLGFAEAELLIEFGYPTQKLTLQKEDLEVSDCE